MVNIQRSDLTQFVEKYLLKHLTREYILTYNHFDIYNKHKEDMEYLISFKNTNHLMVITLYYIPNENDITLRSIAIGTNIVGEQINTYTLSKKYSTELPTFIVQLEKQLFSNNTI